MSQFLTLLNQQPISKSTKDLVKPAEYIFSLFEQVGITRMNFESHTKLIDGCIRTLAGCIPFLTPASENGRGKSRPALTLVQNALQITFCISPSDINTLKCYKVHVQSRDVVSDRGGIPQTLSEMALSFWCFSSGVAMQELINEGARSIVFASGTLAPLDSFAHEMGIAFPHRLENTHVISPSQIYVGVIPKGPAGHVLSSAYELRESKSYLQDLGNSIANLSKIVPDGVLIFFTSYGALSKAMNEWKVQHGVGSTLWDRIKREKPIFFEPKDKNEFKDAIANYEASVTAKKGGLFLAVCRGKASEGLDFADKKARAVLICGIPFPYAKDPKVLLKKKILDDVRGKGNSGSEWYNQQAARAVNQAIGRVIRHCKDYGAILLCDERFGRPHMIKQLPLWVRPFVDTEVRTISF